MNISAITPIDAYSIQEILTSGKISEAQKVEFIRKNRTEIKNALNVSIMGNEFSRLMKNRPLEKFKPLKNSFTKRGDKILLAKTLGIKPAEVCDYISEVQDEIEKINSDLSFLPPDKIDAIKTYVYRHGSTDNIVAFMDYELRTTKDLLSALYRTLDYHTNGVADYFIRPIHRMSNKTLVRIYNAVDKNIHIASKNGLVNEHLANEASRWALIRIYQIQNNSKLINAIKTYKVLKG